MKKNKKAEPHERFLRRLHGKERAGMKCCVRCGRERPITQFHRQTRARDGHMSWCQDCAKKNARIHHKEHGNAEALRLLREGAVDVRGEEYLDVQ